MPPAREVGESHLLPSLRLPRMNGELQYPARGTHDARRIPRVIAHGTRTPGSTGGWRAPLFSQGFRNLADSVFCSRNGATRDVSCTPPND
jgi:hypothetical protein